MKKLVLLTLLIFTISFVSAQDIIITKEGKKLEAKVTEINEFDIKYKKYDYLDGPTYTLKKLEIATIIYENGQVEVFNLNMNTQPAPHVTPSQTRSVLYTQEDLNRAKFLRDLGRGFFIGGIAVVGAGAILEIIGFATWEWGLAIAGDIMMYAGSPFVIAGIPMWAVGQTRMNRINRAYPNGFSLYSNEKMNLDLALGGNHVGLKLNF